MEVPFLTLGARIIAVAGDRTRDVRSLAETCVELARRDGIVEETTITKAMEAIVRERRNLYEMHWKDLGVIEQNALRATAAEGSRRSLDTPHG